MIVHVSDAYGIKVVYQALLGIVVVDRLEWDEKATLLHNYKSLGILANPNVLGARSGSRNVVQLVSLQKPLSDDSTEVFGSDDENDGKLDDLLVTI